MASFPSIQPTYSGFRKTSKPKIRVSKLGDGYEFRALYGLPLTQDPKVYDLTFNVSETEADVIEAFLRSRINDQASFTFTPTGEGFTGKTGTFIQSDGSGGAGVIVTVTATNHGVALGDIITVTANSGSLTNNVDYAIKSSSNQNTFTFNSISTDSALVTSQTAITFSLSGEGQFVCDSWTKQIPYLNRAIINCTFREVFEP
tara:strand:- start:274 stop:879 length:606 start_codon:yes stop_codon:yes gene_type:complete